MSEQGSGIRQPELWVGAQKPSGFSLIELMIGMVIGMLGILVMMQVFALAEGQKRSTTSGADATGNGAIAMYGLQRDIQQAGYGFSDRRLLGCNLELRPGITMGNLGSVTINHPDIPDGDPNTDTLLIVYGDAGAVVQGDGITGVSAGNSYPVQTPTSFVAGDHVIAVADAGCAADDLLLSRVANNYVGSAGNPNVAITGTVESMGSAGGVLFNLGLQPRVLAYAVRGGNLTMCDYMTADCSAASAGNWVPIASNVVGLRAQYGRDTSAQVTQSTPGFNPITGVKMPVVSSYDQITPTNACEWSRMSALRLVLVARSGQLEPSAPTSAAPVWAGSAGAPINLTEISNWQKYRYKTFEQTVGIRNAAWQGVVPGC